MRLFRLLVLKPLKALGWCLLVLAATPYFIRGIWMTLLWVVTWVGIILAVMGAGHG